MKQKQYIGKLIYFSLIFEALSNPVKICLNLEMFL